jgi:protein tyrosine phosphatase (PTP) superfamily phosphohydrolase (DUF442 family)
MYWYLAIVIVLCGVCFLILRHKLYYHFKTVEKGKLYRSGMLSPLGLRIICKLYNIRTIIDLTSLKESVNSKRHDFSKAYCQKHNIMLVHIPMLTLVEPTLQQVETFITTCRQSDSQPVLIHCKHGVLRTGMMVAAYLKKQYNWDNQKILESLPDFGHNFHSQRYAIFKKFILNYAPGEEPSRLTAGKK